MRTLKITLLAREPLRLPLAYNELVQGALYACWRPEFAALHDVGYAVGGKAYRLFTFGPLQGSHIVQNKQITFTGPVSFELRSPVQPLVQAVVETLAGQGEMRLGAQTLPVVGLRTADQLLFRSRHRVRMVAPVTMHTTLENGHTHYYTPQDAEFAPLVCGNLGKKIEAAGLPLEPVLGLVPCVETLRKCVTRFKGIYITGWQGDFWLEADPRTIAFLYLTGMGDRNSQGFGMFELAD
jgi:CRISPR-associated endoribonuclease Cas6